MRELRMGDGNLLCTAVRGSAVAPVPGRRLRVGLRVFRCRRLRIAEYGTGLLCFGLGQQPLGQRVQGRFELLAVGFAQRSATSIVDDAVQFLHIHVHTAARSFLFHDWLSKSRNFGVSA